MSTYASGYFFFLITFFPSAILLSATHFFIIIYLFIHLWLCWVFVSVRGLSLVAASGGHSLSRPLVAEHRLQTRRLSNCGSRTQLLRGMWDLPRPGLEPVSPALAGRFSTRVPCIGRQILNHCVTREALVDIFMCMLLVCSAGPLCTYAFSYQFHRKEKSWNRNSKL